MERPLIFAHRGASGYEPENTLKSFKKAIELQADGIELDIFICKTGEIVVIHDETVDRTTNGTGAVEALTYDQLSTLNAGRGEQIPLLSQVIELVNQQALLNIEIKDIQAVESLAKMVHDYLQRGWSTDNFLISSFDWNALEKFAFLEPTVALGLLFDENFSGDMITIVKQYKAQYAIPHYRSITPLFIKQAHHEHVQVLTYTVNDKKVAQQLTEFKIDGIITNYPDILSTPV